MPAQATPLTIRLDCYLENRDYEAFSNLNWPNIEAYFCGETDKLVLSGGDPTNHHDQSFVVCTEYGPDREFERQLEAFERSVNEEFESRRPRSPVIRDTTLVDSSARVNRESKPPPRRGRLLATAPKEWRYGHIFNNVDENISHQESYRPLAARVNVTVPEQTSPSFDIPGPIRTYIGLPRNKYARKKLKEIRKRFKPKEMELYSKGDVLSIRTVVKYRLRRILRRNGYI